MMMSELITIIFASSYFVIVAVGFCVAIINSIRSRRLYKLTRKIAEKRGNN